MERSYCDMLFEDQIGVYINAKIKLAVFDKPVIKKEFKSAPTVCGVRGISVQVDDPYEDYVVGRMMGMPMETGDEEEDLASASFLFLQDVPIEKAIEIYSLTGEVRFKDIESILHAWDVADKYLYEVEQRKLFSPNFAGVPAEDIEKLQDFVEGLRWYVDQLKTGTNFDIALNEILKSAFFSSIFENEEGDSDGLLVTRKDKPEDQTEDLFSSSSTGGFSR